MKGIRETHINNILKSSDREKLLLKPIREVTIDGLAVLKIVKHCSDNPEIEVNGSLLGIDVDGVMEVTYAYPSPVQDVGKSDNIDGDGDREQLHLEMLSMLSQVQVDNNVVGWYQSMYLGTLMTKDIVNYQDFFQSAEELGGNAIVIMYDPIQSKKGSLVIKAFRLSDRFLQVIRSDKNNDFIKPSDIFEELPLKIINSGYCSGFVRSLQDSHREEVDCTFDSLSFAGSDLHIERHLERFNTYTKALLGEQFHFQTYSKQTSKHRQDLVRWLSKRVQENKDRRLDGTEELPLEFSESGLKLLNPAPNRFESLLMIGQMERYCKQLEEHLENTFSKLILVSQITPNQT